MQECHGVSVLCSGYQEHHLLLALEFSGFLVPWLCLHQLHHLLAQEVHGLLVCCLGQHLLSFVQEFHGVLVPCSGHQEHHLVILLQFCGHLEPLPGLHQLHHLLPQELHGLHVPCPGHLHQYSPKIIIVISLSQKYIKNTSGSSFSKPILIPSNGKSEFKKTYKI